MRIKYKFSVAGFTLQISLPQGWNVDALLPSFRAFRCPDEAEETEKLLTCTVYAAAETERPSGVLPGTLLESTVNDMGYVSLYKYDKEAEGYCVTLSAEQKGRLHVMQADVFFSTVQVYLYENERLAGHALSSLLRIAYSQAVLYRGGISLHASAVFCGNRAFLFMGRSGTGKSTHAALWMKYVPGVELLNDDNPTLRMIQGKAYTYGTPWSGKTPCYKPLCFPLGGMVRLKQAPANRFYRQTEVDAFAAILPGCSVIRQDVALRSCLYDTLVQLAEQVPVGILECRPDKEAALMCHRALSPSDQ